VQCAREVRTRAYRAAEAIRHSLRNGFTAYIALSPAIGFLATVAAGTYRQLDASTEASGPHVFAVRFSALRQERIRVHRDPFSEIAQRARERRVRPPLRTPVG